MMSPVPEIGPDSLFWALHAGVLVVSLLVGGIRRAEGVSVIEEPEPTDTSEDLEMILLAAAGRLWRKVSHEANNSLSSIMGNSEIGLMTKQPDRMARGLEASGRAARELRQLFVSLSDLSSGTADVMRSKENIRDVIRPVVTLLQRSLEKAGVRLHEPPGDLPIADCDRRKLAMAVAALTARLLDEMRLLGGGELRFGATEANGVVSIEIAAHHASVDSGGAPSDRRDPGIEERLAAAVCELHGGALARETGSGCTSYRLRILASGQD